MRVPAEPAGRWIPECPGRGLRSGHRAEAASCKQRRWRALPEATRTASETVKNRSKKSSKEKNPSSSSSSSKLPPVCYEIITLKTKKKKTAADIFRRRKPANSSSTSVHQYHQQNLSNHNLIPAPNWQGLYPTIRERNAVMFNNDLMADVRFVVGPPGGTQQLPGHKYVLAVGSSVFHAMFYGELAEDKGEIRIPDVDPAAFLAMLKYIYCDEMDLAAVTVLATLYAAKKYIVPHLARACVNLLETSMSAKNACVLLSQSCLFEEPGLTQRCWEVIDAQAELALKSEGFCDIDFQTLENILRRETECQRNCGFRGSSQLGWSGMPATRSGFEHWKQARSPREGALLDPHPDHGSGRFCKRCRAVRSLNSERDQRHLSLVHRGQEAGAAKPARGSSPSAATVSSCAPTGATSGATGAAATASSSPSTRGCSSRALGCTAPAAARPSTAPRSNSSGRALSWGRTWASTSQRAPATPSPCGLSTQCRLSRTPSTRPAWSWTAMSSATLDWKAWRKFSVAKSPSTAPGCRGGRSPNLYSTLEHASRSSAGSEVHTTLLLAWCLAQLQICDQRR